MNYYEHHIGDYAAATVHLSLIEDAIYSRMLRRYYLQEVPLPVDVTLVARLVGARTSDELEAVRSVLGDFFTLSDDGWHNKRADAEIARYREKCANAALSAANRWGAKKGAKKGEMPPHDVRDAFAMPPHSEGNANEMPPHSEGNANVMPPHSECNAHQTPDSIHQKEQELRAPSRVAEMCMAAIEGGVPAARINQSHPELLALCADPSVTPAMFRDTAREGGGTKPMAWVIRTIAGRLGDAARPGRGSRAAEAFARTEPQQFETGALTHGLMPAWAQDSEGDAHAATI